MDKNRISARSCLLAYYNTVLLRYYYENNNIRSIVYYFSENGNPWQGCKKKQKRPHTYTKRLSGALFVFLKLSLLKGLKNDSILEIKFARVDIIEKTVMHGNRGVCRDLICKVCRILCVHVVTHTVDG